MSDSVKILPLGGQAEMGKSTYCVEINEKIFIIDVGFRFPEVNKLGVDIIIPSYEYLVENKDRVAAIIITHGHDDVMGGLPYLLREVNAPIYAPNLTADLIDQMLSIHKHRNGFNVKYKLNRVKRNEKVNISGVDVQFFPVTHSIPGSVGCALLSNQGYVVYSGEFIIDFGAPAGFKCDLPTMMEIGKHGVLALLCESNYAKNPGYTSPKHKLTSKIEHVFEDSEGRIIISSYAQNIFRTKEIVELSKKYGRKICFYGRDKYDSTNSIVRIGQQLKKSFITIPKEIIAFEDDIPKDDNLVILLSGTPQRIYHDILDIIDGGDEFLKLRDTDDFIVASPVLPGTEKLATKAVDELYKTDTNITHLKNRDLSSMHASEEDIKVILQMFAPNYFIPMKGQYQDFIAAADIAKSMTMKDDHIIIADNGETISFKKGRVQNYRDTITVEDVMIDGIGVGDVGVKVIDDRIQLSNDGVLIIGMTIDSKTRELVCNTDIQSRGFVYLKESEAIIDEVMKIAENELVALTKDKDLETVEVRGSIRDKVNRYLTKTTGKRPVVLPVIIEVESK
ncbi:MAG: ribonuclease J [Thomasclavelia sp.]|jgi:ribonuclease J|nr:ribonuclease J [Thomasclavelia sp.]